MEKNKLIYEGKTKKIYDTLNLNEVICEYKNDITAFNSIKHDVLKNKGNICAEISKQLFQILKTQNIKTQFIKEIDVNHHLFAKLKMIPLEVVLRNFATGSITKTYPIKEGLAFKPPLIQFFLKDKIYKDPLIGEQQIYAMKILNPQQLKEVLDITWKVNIILFNTFKKLDINLIDFKLEYGFNKNNEIILGDEISPDNMRLIDIKTGKKLDKELYRQAIGDPIQGYTEVLKRLKTL